MAENNIIQTKLYDFALQIIKIYKKLKYEKKEFELASQLLRCGTSIGANIEEGIGGQSKKDFIAKFQIALKKSRETYYWCRLLLDSEILDKSAGKKLLNDCNELIKIPTSILKSSISNS